MAYLATDEKRTRAFQALGQRVGLTPASILAADPDALQEVATLGGQVGVDERVTRMRDAAELVVEKFGGSLEETTRLPLLQAKRALQTFYGIGEPGAEKILLLTRSHKVLPLDSNGARALCRIGYGTDHKNYSTMYKRVVEAAGPEMVMSYDWLIEAHTLLRHHGQVLCKTNAPQCEVCPVRVECNYAR